jgi:hypothetical protein
MPTKPRGFRGSGVDGITHRVTAYLSLAIPLVQPFYGADRQGMDERGDPPTDTRGEIEELEEMMTCAMCQQSVPARQVRRMSGRPLCLGCLSLWYGEEDEED